MSSDDDYFTWMDQELKAERRATGGEPCVVCGEAIEARAPWKHRDRHVCSSRCNTTLIRRWKAAIAKGTRPSFSPKPVEVLSRAPRLMHTLPVTSDFPYDFDRFPIPGDVIERHGQHTLYLDVPPGTPLPWQAQSVLDDDLSGLTPVLIFHHETQAWSVAFRRKDGQIARIMLGRVWWNGSSMQTLGRKPLEELGGIYYSWELISDVDSEGVEYQWEAYVFTPLPPSEKLWTPARTALSQKRRRTTRAKGSYNARMRSIGVLETDAEDVDPLEIFERDGWVCAICRGTIDSSLVWPDTASPSLDHVIPVIQGGAHSADNLQASHLGCNIIKNDGEVQVSS